MKVKKCRICEFPITKIVSFGRIPAVNYYLTYEDLKKPEKKYILNFCICKNCTLGQLDEIINPKKLFSNYHYASSVSKPLKIHLEDLGQLCFKRFNLGKDSCVLDIGCNDGVFLKKIAEHGVSTLGIDPAKNIVSKLQEINIPAITNFFSYKLAQKLSKQYLFDLIACTNTLAQIVNLTDFIKGIKSVLKKDGIFVAEVGYLLDMINKKTFDSIYHEHYSYFSLKSLKILFEKQGLIIFDAQKISIHGGSLRIFATHVENRKRNYSKRFYQILNSERSFHLEKKKTYSEFSQYCKNYKEKFRQTLSGLKKKNQKIIGVSSPAKGVILLNYCKLNGNIIEYIVDSTPFKQNRFMPGTHIPIFPEEKLKNSSPDYLIILAWTYKDIILKKLAPFRKKGVKIIIPLPILKII